MHQMMHFSYTPSVDNEIGNTGNITKYCLYQHDMVNLVNNCVKQVMLSSEQPFGIVFFEMHREG
jgi:hypothetical protein